MKSEKIKELLERGVEEVIKKEALEKDLKSGKKLRVKFGIDPTASDIHLGHTVALRKLKQFQDLGHKIVLIIGDFTATIGDPSGRSDLRKPLTRKEIRGFMKGYENEIGKILNIKKTEIRYNSEWYDKLGAMFMYELTSKITIQRAIERDDFKKRIRQDQDVSMLEVIYPLLQGYDSVEVKADVEIGGTDQKFNLLMGRKIQKRYGMKEQNIITTWLLEGTDGVRKMSKSIGNYIGISEPPSEMYGKIMSVPDALMVKYFRVLTDTSDKKIDKMKLDLQSISTRRIDPRKLKAELARKIVTMYHSEKKAEKAEQDFINQFSKRELPEKIKEFKFSGGDWRLADIICDMGLTDSKTEARRLIEQNAVKVDGAVISERDAEIGVRTGMIIQVGKRRFGKIKVIK